MSTGSPTRVNDKKYTPLPLSQLTILLLLRFCEVASNFVIYPFLNELLTSVTGGDEKRVGYYAGLMNVIRQLSSLVTVMFWTRMSDHIGRKPILLLGMLTLAISNVSFGLSRTFWGLVISRCIFSALNSNEGVMKSVVGEITDPTNTADAFALLHIPWALGVSFGAFLGGWLARPHDHFPKMFSGWIWIQYPYLLPFIVLTVITVMIFAVTAVYLNETVRSGYFKYITTLRRRIEDDGASEPLLNSSQSSSPNMPTTNDNEESVPLKDLLNLKVLVPVFGFVYLCFLETASSSIQPLFLAMPVNIGGLGLPPRDVGYIFGVYGFVNSIFQLVFLGRLVRWFGVKALFVTSMSAFIPIFALSPILNLIVRRDGFSYVVWVALGCQLSACLVMELGFGVGFIYITAASPNKRSLGATNGLAMTLVSVGKILAPAISDNLLAFSIQHDILWGYAVYIAFLFFTIGGIGLAYTLPTKLDWMDR